MQFLYLPLGGKLFPVKVANWPQIGDLPKDGGLQKRDARWSSDAKNIGTANNGNVSNVSCLSFSSLVPLYTSSYLRCHENETSKSYNTKYVNGPKNLSKKTS